MSNRRVTGWCLRGGVLLVTLALLYSLVDVRNVVAQLRALPCTLVMAAVAIGMVRVALQGVRWMIVNAHAGSGLRTWDYVRYAFLANSFTMIMPGALGGDLARSAMVLGELDRQRTATMLSIVLDRAIGMLSIVLLAAGAVLLSPHMPRRAAMLALTCGMLALMVLFLAALRSARIFRWLGMLSVRTGRYAAHLQGILVELHRAVRAAERQPLRMLGALLLCVPIHLLWFCIAFALARHLGMPVSFLTISLATALVWLVTVVPVSLAGVGVRELSYVYLLAPYGVSAEAATALSLTQFAIMAITACLGIPLLLAGRARHASLPAMEGDAHAAH